MRPSVREPPPTRPPETSTPRALQAQSLININLRTLRSVPLSARMAQQLPKPSSWSVFQSVVADPDLAPVSLSGLKRAVSKGVLQYALNRGSADGLSLKEITKSMGTDALDWSHTKSFVISYHPLVDDPSSPVSYSRRVNMSPFRSPFPLTVWWDMIRDFCPTCQAHHERYGKNATAALASNETNPCTHADILSFISGEWRIPFSSIPPPGKRRNYESLSFDPEAMQAEVERMKDWRTIVPGTPHLIHPAMGVVRSSDIYDACRLLAAIGHPSPSESKRDVKVINEHIKLVLDMGVHVPSHLGLLKPLKVRFVIDASILLNPFVKKWKFKYATIHDAVRLIRRFWYMARIDLRKFFNQIPLHRDDWAMFGVELPKDLHTLGDALEKWVSAFAHFGGRPFPALVNAIMSLVSAILTATGIPNVFITDDIFVCGPTFEACQAILDRAVSYLIQLGWILQHDKITIPSQVMPFVGIEIDSRSLRLSIPQDKLDNTGRTIDRARQDAAEGNLLAKDLESLIGKLGNKTEVMIAGKAYLAPLRQALPGDWYQHRHSQAKAQLDEEATMALDWWASYIKNAQHHPYWVPFWSHSAPIQIRVFSDASGDTGFGLALGNTVFQGLWSDEILSASSGLKELIPVLLAVMELGPEAKEKIVVITTDNLSNVLAINKGICKSPESQKVLAVIMELAAEKQLYLVADWNPREDNVLMDDVSKNVWGSEATTIF